MISAPRATPRIKPQASALPSPHSSRQRPAIASVITLAAIIMTAILLSGRLTAAGRAAPPAPLPIVRDLVFVRDLDSVGACDGADAWVPAYMESDDGKLFGTLQVGQYLHFSYADDADHYACPPPGSTALPWAYTALDTCDGIANAAEVLQALIDAQATAPVTLVGHGTGGVVAAYLVARDPVWTRAHVASVVTFDSPLQGLSVEALAARARFSACRLDDAPPNTLQELREDSPVMRTAAGAAEVVPLYPLHATEFPWLPREQATLESARPFRLTKSCDFSPRPDCQPPRSLPDDHDSLWGQRFDGDGQIDKAFLLGCAALPALDGTARSVPLTPESAWRAQASVARGTQRVRFVARFNHPVRMTLLAPDGTAFGPDGAGAVTGYAIDAASETYEIQDPTPGAWTVEWCGTDVPPAGATVTLAVLALARSGPAFYQVDLPAVLRDNPSAGGPVNDPPYAPAAPWPVNGATLQDVDLLLRWSGGDPEGDTVTYDVYLAADDSTPDDPTPDVAVCNGITRTLCHPGPLEHATHYYWQVIAEDETGATTQGPVWGLRTISHPPAIPANPAPPDGAVNQDLDVALRWTGGDPDGDAVTYDVYLKAADPTPDTLCSHAMTDTHFSPGPLSLGTHYYWRVVARDAEGLITPGPIWELSTTHAPHAPRLLAPLDGAANQPLSLTLRWDGDDPDGDALTFDLYLEAGDETPDVQVLAGDAATIYTPPALAPGMPYFWRVVAHDGHGALSSSPTWAFTSTHTPDMPHTPCPCNRSINQPLTATLAWSGDDPDGDNVTYDVYLAADDPTPDTLCSHAVTDTHFSPGPLIAGAHYYWRVVAQDTNEAVTPGPVWDFSTTHAPRVLSFLTPLDGAINQPLSLTLGWIADDPDGDALTFDLYLEAGDETPDVQVLQGGATTTYRPPILATSAPYYWRVVAHDGHGATASGPTWVFTTTRAPRVPSVPSPGDGITNRPLTATLAWSGGDPDGDSVTYDVYLAAGDPTPEAPVATGQYSATYDPGALQAGTPYYWRVIAHDAHGATASGPTWVFTTTYPPHMPYHPHPPDGAIHQPLTVTLAWDGGDPDGDGVAYDVYLETGDPTPDVLVAQGQTGTTFTPDPLTPGALYYWQVVATDRHGLAASGPVWCFTALPYSWQQVGPGSATGGGVSATSGDAISPTAAVAPDGTPYVAWQDDSDGLPQIYVRRWDGETWEAVGSGSASGNGISHSGAGARAPVLAIAPNGTPCVAWHDADDGDAEIYVRCWNGEDWEEIGAGSASGGGISDNAGESRHPTLAFAPDNMPYVAWHDDSDGDTEIYVRRWNGEDWEEIGAGSASGGGISDNTGASRRPAITLDLFGSPMLDIVWQDDSSGTDQVYGLHWGAGMWHETGEGTASGGGISATSGDSGRPSLVTPLSCVPYLAWHDTSTGVPQIYLRRFNGSFWPEMGEDSASAGGVSDTADASYSPSLAVMPDGTPYVAWHDDSDGDAEIYVRRWNGESWEEVGAGSASGGGVSDNAGQSRDAGLVIAPDGTPYVFWCDDSSGHYEIYARWYGLGVDTTRTR